MKPSEVAMHESRRVRRSSIVEPVMFDAACPYDGRTIEGRKWRRVFIARRDAAIGAIEAFLHWGAR